MAMALMAQVRVLYPEGDQYIQFLADQHSVNIKAEQKVEIG